MNDMPATAPRAALLLFGAGDFAFNLYWQAVNLYLLFFYIDTLRLAPALAGTLFLIGAAWDGAADFAAGVVAERMRRPYRWLIGWGALPLGLAFVAMFAAPAGAWPWALVAQLGFRTLYAFTNIPYAAWTTRLAGTSAERSLLAGLRMIFGAVAATFVAGIFPQLVQVMGGYAAASALLALLGVPLLLAIALRVPERRPPPTIAVAPRIGPALALLARNRAFVALNLAAAAGAAAAALTTQSVLYFFRYVLADDPAGPRALAAMAFASLIATPLWTIAARRAGARAAWLAACGLALALPAAFVLLPAPGVAAATLFLLCMQVAFAGFGLAAWTLLPDCVDWGAARTGVRVEAIAFGAFALAQKAALAAAGFAIGAIYQASGFVAGAPQTATSLAAIRWLMLAGPALLLLAALAAILALPLRKNTLADLAT
ncbi:Isoprimeverose transporter [Sphingomonas sp. S2M10]|uniref:MFS transporter n=1 Tax=Sphingomonas sp. S2M10 TaxID=2705010 RepID=UPI001456DF8F|nr:MFS transporter [Sphingomonas sp. S2M10]NLS27046.1 Isoprimeverose transporter [Sphingomonas sp. S2M10]